MNELKAARAVAEHWRRRYQAGQALIAELQGERETLEKRLSDTIWVVENYRKIDENLVAQRDALAAQIAELQGEKKRLNEVYDDLLNSLADKAIKEMHTVDALKADRDYLADKVLEMHGYGDAPVIRSHQHQPGAGLLGDNIVDEGRYIRRDDGSFFWWSDYKREETQHAPGAGLLGPYTPPPDPIQGVEDGWWIGCESWETWDGDE